MNLNKAMIIGNLVRDPEIKNTANGKSVASFSIATSLMWTDQSGQKQEKAEFHNIVAWGRLSEICGQYLKKGAKIYLEGRLQTRDWTGQDGIKRYRTEIIAENMIMLDSRASGGNNQVMPNRQTVAPSEPVIDIDEPIENNETDHSEEEIRVENIPF
ncbi:single-stranded DNA-binding protein [Patescibacteria group bacterium]|nr:single-stranded DNA-binding protein [Patescibacteria group bacterium]MBU0879592.1 single-stranded DNA-binding protein [Patescibacteria group bacterium]MBU0880524.1 single-stranded DNA-binding protein [Patescibacteria group bacterium]MBU0898010.1 single-stranded DNA-binding protein [Patescibacteria group bacterium]MBU1063050.1 single-stranded DNA-binding protein [Patescibacteria group bacterium]